jgi:cation transporter-like permease
VSIGARVSAALLLGGISVQRLRLRTVLLAMGVVAVAITILPFALAVLLLNQL